MTTTHITTTMCWLASWWSLPLLLQQQHTLITKTKISIRVVWILRASWINTLTALSLLCTWHHDSSYYYHYLFFCCVFFFLHMMFVVDLLLLLCCSLLLVFVLCLLRFWCSRSALFSDSAYWYPGEYDCWSSYSCPYHCTDDIMYGDCAYSAS